MKMKPRPPMTIHLPDFSVYQRKYVMTADVPTKRDQATITCKLVQDKQYFTMWKWVEDKLNDTRAGHTLRRGTEVYYLLSLAMAYLHRDAVAAARDAGWIVDPENGIWDAPLGVWKSCLTTIQDGGW